MSAFSEKPTTPAMLYQNGSFALFVLVRARPKWQPCQAVQYYALQHQLFSLA